MIAKKNFLEFTLKEECIHDGLGLCRHAQIFSENEFQAPIRFFNYTVLPKGASFGAHEHKDDNEIYVILEGEGHYECNGEITEVKPGDVLVNPPYGTHALYNDSGLDVDMRVLVIEGYNR